MLQLGSRRHRIHPQTERRAPNPPGPGLEPLGRAAAGQRRRPHRRRPHRGRRPRARAAARHTVEEGRRSAQDGEVREGAWVAENPDLLDLGSWPHGARVIVRGERPARRCPALVHRPRRPSLPGRPRRARRPAGLPRPPRRCVGNPTGPGPTPRPPRSRARPRWHDPRPDRGRPSMASPPTAAERYRGNACDADPDPRRQLSHHHSPPPASPLTIHEPRACTGPGSPDTCW